MAAWMSLLEAHAAVTDALEERLEAELGLALSWHEVLVRLQEAPDGRLRMQDLGRSVLLTKSGVSRLVDRMQHAGLVSRAACAADRRVTYAGITPKGRRLLARAVPVFVRSFEESFARHLSQREAAALRSALAGVIAAHGRGESSCPSAYVQGAREAAAAR